MAASVLDPVPANNTAIEMQDHYGIIADDAPAEVLQDLEVRKYVIGDVDATGKAHGAHHA